MTSGLVSCRQSSALWLAGVVLAVGCGFATEVGAVQQAELRQNAKLRCGSYCLYVAMKALGGGPESFAALEKHLGTPGPNGYSIAQLGDAAEAEGFHALAVRTSVEQLARRDQSFVPIALLDRGHFVIVRDHKDNEIAVVDPPASSVVPKTSFEATWSGQALLISRTPLEPLKATSSFPWLGGLLAAVGVAAIVAWVVHLVRTKSA